jgi:hypothetical protein
VRIASECLSSSPLSTMKGELSSWWLCSCATSLVVLSSPHLLFFLSYTTKVTWSEFFLLPRSPVV